MLEKTLVKITGRLDAGGIPYMVLSGYAIVIHGFSRLTQDLDISLGVDTGRLDDVLNATQSEFQPLSKDPRGFARDTNVLLLQDIETGVRVDLIFTSIDFERKAIDNADKVELHDGTIKVASLEDLIIYKMLAGRARDIEDVRMILAGGADSIASDRITDTIREFSSLQGNNSYREWISILKDRKSLSEL